MSRIAIVGGHGKVALQMLPLLREAGHVPVALVRDEGYRAELEQAGAEVRLLDLEQADAETYAASVAGCDAVVFAAGGGGDGSIERKQTVDLGGALKTIAAATKQEVSRYVMVSAIGVDEPLPDDTEAVWRAYVEAKRDADAALRASSLDWTIVRPGRLTDDPATGSVALGDDVERGDISRSDVAAVVVAVLDSPAAVGRQFNAVGGSTPVADAVASL